MSSFGFVAALVAFLVTYLTVPVILKAAVSRKLLDYPDGGRHTHARAVPRLGGVAVFLGLVAGIAVGTLGNMPGAPTEVPDVALALVGGGAILFAIGLFDDLRGVTPVVKLAAQALAALCVWAYGFRIETLILPPTYEVALSAWVALPLTVFWIVGVSNAFNLVDGMDGLAGGVAIIALLASAATALILGDSVDTWYCFVLVAALVAFLKYNVAPARIFLGDSGSLVVGFLLAVLSVRSASRLDGAVYALAPIFALSYPLLDTGIAIMRRWLRGEPLSRADGRHIHHQLLAISLTPRRAAAVIYVKSASIAILGLLVTFARPELTIAVAALGATILLLIMSYGLRWLDYHEFAAAGASLASAARQARSVIQDKIVARDLARSIRDAATITEVQTLLAESAEDFRCLHMELRAGYGTDASPDASVAPMAMARAWRLEYPVAEHTSVSRGMLFLNIWCSTNGDARPASPERVARIVAPAVASWLSRAMPGAKFPADRPYRTSAAGIEDHAVLITDEHCVPVGTANGNGGANGTGGANGASNGSGRRDRRASDQKPRPAHDPAILIDAAGEARSLHP